MNVKCFPLVLVVACLASPLCAGDLPDRFVWVFGWNLRGDGDVAEITKVIEAGAGRGINGAVCSFGFDSLCKGTPEFFRRLEEVRAVCDRRNVELIPGVFSVGYASAALAHDRNLAEGLPVEDALFVVNGGEARFTPDAAPALANGDFEKHNGDRFPGFDFHDDPGKVSFADTEIRHGGACSLRLENFTSNPHGHGRIKQEVAVRPRRCYRLSLWVKTEGLEPPGAFAVQVLVKNRALAPKKFGIPATSEWRKLTMLFNSLSFDRVRLYAGIWGGRAGKVWIDDWTIEEAGPLNVLHRPGTPVLVRAEEGAAPEEGRDYLPLDDPKFSPNKIDRDWPALKLPPGTRLRDGQHLRVSWYHAMAINESQVTACMAEPALYDYFDHEAALLADRLHPRRVMLNTDEVRMGGSCRACRGRDMAQLLGECVTRQAAILRKHIPGVEVYLWSDMFDPHHNAHGDYFLVEGDFSGSHKHIPKDLVMAVWGGKPRPESMRFFAENGFRTLAACYYDAEDLEDVKGWLDLARETNGARGLMYTPWQRKYDLLPAFGDLLRGR